MGKVMTKLIAVLGLRYKGKGDVPKKERCGKGPFVTSSLWILNVLMIGFVRGTLLISGCRSSRMPTCREKRKKLS